MKRDYLDRLQELALASSSFDAALALTLEEFRAESGTIHWLEGGVLKLRACSAGMPAPVLAMIQVIPVGKGMAGLAAERRAPVTACNLQTDQSGDVRPGARATGLQGSIVVPMLRGERVIGTLGIANRGERTFHADEVELLLAAGRTIAAWDEGA